MFSKDQRFGMFWEKVALEKLHDNGYTQARLVANFMADTDIMLGNLPIEVKAANPKPHSYRRGGKAVSLAIRREPVAARGRQRCYFGGSL